MATRRKKSTHTKRRRRTTVTVGRRRAPRRRRVSGVGAVGSTHHKRRRRRSVGSMSSNTLKSIATTALGIAGGAIATHMLLRPLEKHVTDRFPMATKFIGAGEILLGGFIAMKAKNPLVKAAGLGIMGGGVNTMMHQFNIGQHAPGISGDDDYSIVRVPMSGNIRSLINGIYDGQEGPTYTNYVAGAGDGMGSSSAELWNTAGVAGTSEEDAWLPPIGYEY